MGAAEIARQSRIFSHGVPGHIQPRRQLFIGKLLLGRVFRHVRDGRLCSGGERGTEIEETDLPFDLPLFVCIELTEHVVDHLHHLAAVKPEAIQRAGTDQVFERAAVELFAVAALAERIEAFIRTVEFPFVKDHFDHAAAEILDRKQAEPHVIADDREFFH